MTIFTLSTSAWLGYNINVQKGRLGVENHCITYTGCPNICHTLDSVKILSQSFFHLILIHHSSFFIKSISVEVEYGLEKNDRSEKVCLGTIDLCIYSNSI